MSLLRRQLTGLALLLTLSLVATQAMAQTTLVTTPGGITGTGAINWSTLGANGTLVNTPFNVGVTGLPGVTSAAVSQATGTQVATQLEGTTPPSFWGDFAANAPVLAVNGGPLTLTFNGLISGFGAQIQSQFAGTFSASITALDSLNNVLGTFTVSNLLSQLQSQTGNAPFIGILSTSANIKTIVIDVPVGPSIFGIPGLVDHQFAIGNPVLQGAPAVVPEPTSIAVWCVAGLTSMGAGWWRKRRRVTETLAVSA